MILLTLSPMAYSLTVGTIAFLIAWIIGKPVIAFLRQKKIGKAIRIDGPATHQVKTGTPTMGGVIIFITVFIVTVVFRVFGGLSILLPLLMIVSTGLIGGIDDWMSLIGKRDRGGMRARTKMAGLIVVATIAAFVLYFLLEPNTFFPFIRGPFRIGVEVGLWYIPLAIFVIVGTANAVNITDGLDSLAGFTTATAFVAYGIIAFLQHQVYLVTFCFVVVGATLAFLWYNAHPAQVFMGDTGALSLGSTLAVVALMTGHWILLPVIGIVFVAEIISDIIQIGYFKLTHGKRFFKMAPLHHHFELLGWSEVQVAQRFWLVGILAAMLGVALALS